MDNQMVPVASTVLMNKQTLAAARKAGITVVVICRNRDDLAQVRTLNDGTHENAVGHTMVCPTAFSCVPSLRVRT